MRKIDFIRNKYTISVLILLACMAVDVFLHRGMSRVMLPSTFSDSISPFSLKPVPANLSITNKEWAKAMNSVEKIRSCDTAIAGFECDLYFDSDVKTFFVYHDTSEISDTDIKTLLDVYRQRKLSASIWFDLKNINASNCDAAIQMIDSLRSLYNLTGKLILETKYAECLNAMNAKGYFTSYYVPSFNPYEMDESQLIKQMNDIASELNQHPASALSGYYFQYPALKKFFPIYPFLTWSQQSNVSLISFWFNRQLKNDDQVKVILYDQEL